MIQDEKIYPHNQLVFDQHEESQENFMQDQQLIVPSQESRRKRVENKICAGNCPAPMVEFKCVEEEEVFQVELNHT